MTKFQKIIKYLAMAFAIFLTVSIISGIVKGIMLFGGILAIKNNDGDMPGTTYENEIQSLEIDVVGVDLVIKSGEIFSVETDNEHITQKEKRGKVTIEEKKNSWFGADVTGTLVVTVPEDVTLEEIEIDAGAGKIEIQGFTTEKMDLDLGAGKVEIDGIVVVKETNIDGGAGNLVIKDSELNNLDLDMGVGELKLAAKVTGNSDIDFGIGEADVTLIGSLDDYRIRMNKGIGQATIDGESMRNDTYYGEGASSIDMEGGIGEITITFGEQGQEI